MSLTSPMLLPRPFTPRGDGRRLLARFGLWMLSTLLALQALRLVWMAVVPPAPIGSPVAAMSIMATTSPAGFDPFFPRTATARADATASGLTLFGIRGGTGGGAAIIADADAGGTQRAWRVGDSVRPGLTLARVAVDHIVLASGGQQQRLDFVPEPPSVAATPSPAATELPRGLPASAPAAGGTAIDPAQLLAQAGLQPLNEGDRVTGYTLVPRSDGALLRQAGLAAGDVLLAVNGQALTPERYSTLAADLESAPELTISYRRGTETRSTTVRAPAP